MGLTSRGGLRPPYVRRLAQLSIDAGEQGVSMAHLRNAVLAAVGHE
jgi:hypothetical protein